MTRCDCPSDCYYVHFQDLVAALLDDFKEGKAVVYKCTLQPDSVSVLNVP